MSEDPSDVKQLSEQKLDPYMKSILCSQRSRHKAGDIGG
jgi:hypothetical protein